MHTTPLLAATLLAAVLALGLAPVAAADGPLPDDGATRCEKIAGRYTCVAVFEGDCAVWASAGFGGCLVAKP